MASVTLSQSWVPPDRWSQCRAPNKCHWLLQRRVRAQQPRRNGSTQPQLHAHLGWGRVSGGWAGFLPMVFLALTKPDDSLPALKGTRVAQWAGHGSANCKFVSSIPGQACAQVVASVSDRALVRGSRSVLVSHIVVSLPLFILHFPSL